MFDSKLKRLIAAIPMTTRSKI